jgi:hypothetical protein
MMPTNNIAGAAPTGAPAKPVADPILSGVAKLPIKPASPRPNPMPVQGPVARQMPHYGMSRATRSADGF